MTIPLPKKLRWQNVFCLLLGVFVSLYVFSRFTPCAPATSYPRADSISRVDYSWAQIMHVAFIKHLQFGKDVVFSFGPWGFLANGYHPQTFILAMASWVALSVVFLLAGWRLARFMSKNLLVAGVWLVVFAAASSLPVSGDFDARLAAWAVLLLCLHFFVEDGATTPLQAALVMSLAWMSLIKFTGFMISVPLVAIIAADNVYRQHRFPWIIPLWLVAFLFFWFAADQSLSNLGMFLGNSWQISSGYTEAMMLSGKQEIVHTVCFLVLGLLMSLFAWRLAWGHHRFFGLLFVAGLGVILFLTFKHAYVRDDWQHEAPSVMVLVLVSLAFLALAGRESSQTIIVAFCLLAGCLLYASSVFDLCFPAKGLKQQFARTFSFDALTAPIMAPFTGSLRNYHEMIRLRDWKNYPVPPMRGDADVYAYDQVVLFAHRLPYTPRPVVQSYSAYTPNLAELNAAHLRSDAAADNILFAIQPTDQRYPSLEDGLSWPELLTRYDIRGPTDDKESFLMLTRATVPRRFHLLPLGNTIMHFDEPVAVPEAADGPVWAEIEVENTPLGKLASTFYKPPLLMLTVKLRDRRKLDFRLVPGMTRCGFLLSPLIADNRSFAALAATGWRDDLKDLAVESMAISVWGTTNATVCYRVPISVRFYRLNFPSQRFNFAKARLANKN